MRSDPGRPGGNFKLFQNYSDLDFMHMPGRIEQLIMLGIILSAIIHRVGADEPMMHCLMPLDGTNTHTTLTQVRSLNNVAVRPLAADMAQFCDESNYDGIASLVFGLNTPEGKRAFRANPESVARVQTPWDYSWLPNEKLRLKTYDFGTLNFKNAKELREFLKNRPSPLTQAEVEDINDSIRNIFAATSIRRQGESDMASSWWTQLSVCSSIPNLHALACAKGVQRIQEIMWVKNQAHSLPDANRIVLTDERYREGLRLAALKITDKVEAGGKPQGDLYTDIYSSFIASGVKSEEAAEFTWNVLGVISTGGASYARRAVFFGSSKSNTVAKASIAIIAQSMPILDFRSRGSKKLYSYPEGVTTHCDNGKPYYFWMAAYLARRLTQELKSPEAAAAATFTTVKGYQFIARTGNRKPERALVVDTFEGFNNIMRADMAYGAAGARFGVAAAQGKKAPKLDIDKGVRTALKRATIIGNLTQEESDAVFRKKLPMAYWRWNLRFAPDAIYEAFNQGWIKPGWIGALGSPLHPGF